MKNLIIVTYKTNFHHNKILQILINFSKNHQNTTIPKTKITTNKNHKQAHRTHYHTT